jgi:transcriptional regulator with XRE-family HTH domain
VNTKSRCRTVPAEPCEFEDRHQFGAALTALRERAGLSVRDVAKALRIPPATAGDYFSGRTLPPARMAPMLSGFLHLCGITDRSLVDDWHHALVRLRHGCPVSAAAPYLGFAPFGSQDARLFHGRDRLVHELAAGAEQIRRTGGVLATTGPSGSGKSSVLRAGLLPALHGWTPMVMTPHRYPCRRLSDELCRALSIDVDDMDRALHTDPEAMAHLVRRASPISSDGLVLLIDQFEELFDGHHDDRARRTFISALEALSASGVLVVVGMRSDANTEATRHPLLATALRHSRVDVAPMNDVELRNAIEQPARLSGRVPESGLVEIILRDMAPPATRRAHGVAHDPGTLGLLSHVLLAAWRQRKRGRVTVADYLAVGGVRGAVESIANRTLAVMSAPQRDIAYEVFQALVHVEDGRPIARRHVRRDVLPGENAGVIDLLVAHRLITTHHDTVTLSHGSLLTALAAPLGMTSAVATEFTTTNHDQVLDADQFVGPV